MKYPTRINYTTADRARQSIIVRSISLAIHKISIRPLELGIEIEELL